MSGSTKYNWSDDIIKSLEIQESHLTCGNMLQDPQWMPETTDGTKTLHVRCFYYTYIPMIKFNLQIRHTKEPNNR